MIQEREFIPATFDPIFKEIFTSEETKEYRASIINMITGIPYKDLIYDIDIKNNELNISNIKNKKMRADLIISNESYLINIEMNKDYYDGLLEKNGAYQTKILSEQFESGKDYKNIKCIIQINFNNFKVFEKEKMVHKCMMVDVNTGEVETKNFIRYHVGLEKIKEKCYNQNNKKLTKLEKYSLILVLEDRERINKIVGDDIILKKVAEKIEKLNEDQTIIGLYDGEKVDRKVMNTKLLYAEKIGLERGIEQGIEQGKKEMAVILMNKNIDINIISESTGLSIEEINNLKNNLTN